MFETRFPQQLTRYAAELPTLQVGYPAVWKKLRKHFARTGASGAEVRPAAPMRV